MSKERNLFFLKNRLEKAKERKDYVEVGNLNQLVRMWEEKYGEEPEDRVRSLLG